MSYIRVIPRDLFNEGDLLKCYGRLAILLELARGGHGAVLGDGDGSPFDIQQDPGSGAITVANLTFTVRGKPYRLTRPLNSRQPWPLYAEDDDDDIAVFDPDGEFTEEFATLLWGPK